MCPAFVFPRVYAAERKKINAHEALRRADAYISSWAVPSRAPHGAISKMSSRPAEMTMEARFAQSADQGWR